VKYRTLTVGAGDIVKRAIEFGEFLNAEKRGRSGQWLDWLETECGVHRRTAQRCQQLAEPENKAKLIAAMAGLNDLASFSLNKAYALIREPSTKPPPTPSDSYDRYQDKLIKKLMGMKLETAESMVAETKKKLSEAIAEMKRVTAAQH